MRWLLALAVIAVVARSADACGFWTMQDAEKKLAIGWLINSASIEKDDKDHLRLAALYLDIEAKQGIRVVTSRKVVFDIKDDKVLRYGNVVGKIDGDNVVFGKKTYAIELVRNATPLHQDMPDYKLTVTRGSDVVIQAEHASPLCTSALPKDPFDGPIVHATDEIRRRVIYYLAWREFGL
jgi:hypothetical protein